MVENGAIRLRPGGRGLAPKFGDREILVRRFRIWVPFGLKIFGEIGKLEKTGTTGHTKKTTSTNLSISLALRLEPKK